MEKTYKILKIILAVLCVVAVLVAVWRFAGSPVQESSQSMETHAEQATEAAAQTALDFTVYDLEGNPHNLSEFRGKPVVLNFWASWCGPCKSEMPDFEEAYQQYGEQIQFLMVNMTDGSAETVETVTEFIAAQGYTFPVYCDSDLDAVTTYGINAIPVTYFIDAEGCLVAGQRGMLSAEQLQQGIDMLLAE